MAPRETWMLALAFTAVAMLGCLRAETPETQERPAGNKHSEQQGPKRPDGVVGYYVLDDPSFFGATSMKGVPPGQVMYLGIEKGRWMMRNMLTGYGGTWIEGKNGAALNVSVGSTGKTNGKETMLAERTDRGVTLSPNRSIGPAMHFTFMGSTAPKDFGYDEVLSSKK